MVQLYVNGTVIPCIDDNDCPFSSLCYTPLNSMINDTRNSIQFNQCGCSIDTGHQGNFCNAPSANMVYRLVVIIMFILIDLYFIDSIIPDMRTLFQNNKEKKYFGVTSDERLSTLIKCFLTFLFMCLWKISNILLIVDNNNWQIVEFDGFNKNKKKSVYLPFYYISLGCTIYVFTAAVLGIGIMWVETSVASHTLKYESGRKFRWFVKIFNAILWLSLLLCTIFYPSISIGIIVPVALLLIGVFSFGAWKITSTMKELQLNQVKNNTINKKKLESFQRVRKNIIFSAVWVVGSIIGILVFLGICLMYYVNIRVYIQPIGSIYPGAVTMDLCCACIVSAIWGVIWYTRLHINDDYYDGTSVGGAAGAGGGMYEAATHSSSKQDGGGVSILVISSSSPYAVNGVKQIIKS